MCLIRKSIKEIDLVKYLLLPNLCIRRELSSMIIFLFFKVGNYKVEFKSPTLWALAKLRNVSFLGYFWLLRELVLREVLVPFRQVIRITISL